MGRGAGGGGHSGGFSGGRSSGGFGGAGRSSGGFSSGRGSSSSRPSSGRGSSSSRPSGGYRPGNSRPGSSRPGSGYRPTGGYRPAGGYRPSGTYRPNNTGGINTGGNTGGGCCSSFIILPILIILAFFIMFTVLNSTDSGYSDGITESTVSRTPLESSACTEYPEYYTDELFWFGSGSEIESGMKKFYKETGVQPYLFLTDTVMGTNRPTDEQMQEYCENIYDSLFTDGGHLVLLFRQDDDAYDEYQMWVITGSRANHVIDTEACNILMDYIEYYYHDEDVSEEGVFGEAFSAAADRIMNKTSGKKSGVFSTLLIILAIAVVIGALVNRKIQQNKEKARKEQAEREEILNTPLKKFSSEGIDDLKEKYQ